MNMGYANRLQGDAIRVPESGRLCGDAFNLRSALK